ncbi:unnamed protein product [Eruca vesicaria subsp. sativa]|uniref:Uncharacterized protein n=1 Tax=Eruca vesicaria subsp. sativa TaxID=29727 RepID=A0ABC8JBL0_ERUVS|nr:unnamed protein product [Eruca vesicaria subsp. sativa]
MLGISKILGSIFKEYRSWDLYLVFKRLLRGHQDSSNRRLDRPHQLHLPLLITRYVIQRWQKAFTDEQTKSFTKFSVSSTKTHMIFIYAVREKQGSSRRRN